MAAGCEAARASIENDKTTGEMIPLYKFPDVKKPLPIIPSLKAMKICPITGDKNFKSKVVMLYD
ncbi:MAG: hypothetical protein ACKO9H_06780 [Planctomycetota bacterium]